MLVLHVRLLPDLCGGKTSVETLSWEKGAVLPACPFSSLARSGVFSFSFLYKAIW